MPTDAELEEMFKNSIENKPIVEHLFDQSVENVPIEEHERRQRISNNPVLQAVENAVTGFVEVSNANIKRQENLANKTTAASENLKSSIKEATVAEQIIAKQKSIAELKTQNATIEAFNAAGGSDFLTNLMSELESTSKEVLDAQNELEKIQDRETDGVFEYIGKQIDLVVPEEKLKDAVKRQETITKTIGNITAAQESIARATATTRETLNSATIAAEQKKIAAVGKQQLNAAELDSLARNATALDRVVQANARNLDATLSLYRFHNEEESNHLRREEHKLNVKSMELRLEEYLSNKEKNAVELEAAKLRLDQAKANFTESTDPKRLAALQASYDKQLEGFKDATEFRQIATGSIQKAQAILGLPIEEEVNIMWGLSQTGPTGRKYRMLLELGNSDDPVIGHTPGEAAQNLVVAAPEGVKQSPEIQILSTIQSAQAELYRSSGRTPPKDDATLLADFNKTAVSIASGMAKEIKQGDTSNFYHAPPMTVISEFKSVQDTKLYKSILEPLSMKETNPKFIFESAIAGINAKTISIEEAAIGIEAIFKAVIAYNNEHWKFRRIGLPEQETYKSDVVSSRLGTTDIGVFKVPKIVTPKAVNLADVVEVRAALIKELSIGLTIDIGK